MIVIGATMKNRIGTALPSLDRLVSIFVELKVLDFLPPIPIPHFLFFLQLNASLAIVKNGWSCSSTHFCLFTIICPSIQLNKGFPSIQMVILPPETLSRFWNFESEIVPAIAIMTVAGEQGEGGWG